MNPRVNLEPAVSGIKRTQYLVVHGLQLRFTRFVVLFVGLSCVVTGFVIFYTTFMLLGDRLADVYPQGRLVSIFRSVHIAFFVTMILILPPIFCVSILFSHRIAGPLPKIYEALRSVGEGRFDVRLTLRKHDELKELGDAINEMADKLKERESAKS